MIIKLYSNRKVEPSSIIMANQHENMTRVLEFNLEQVPNGYRYLVLTNSSGSNLYLITDNKVDITSAFTWNGQTYEANVVVSNIELENELVSTNVLWISNTFRLQVRRNNINAEELSKLPIPPDLQMPYDKLLQLIEDVEGKLENGEFNGKDGVGIKSIEKTGSEGLVDTYTITLTDDSTFVYSVTNGRDGIDGKSAYELAVENGYRGTEEEWLDSLRYDHSEEFKQLADQVKLDAKSAEDSATKAESAMNEANTTAQKNVEKINKASTDAQNAITTAKDEAIEEIENTGVPLEDIEKLAIKETTTGNPTIISDSADWRLQKLNIYGQSEQDSTTGKNLLNPIGATKSGWNIALPNFKLEIGKTYTYTAPSILTGSKSAGLYAAASDTKLANHLTVGKTATFTVPEEADLSQGILLAGGSADSLVLGDELTAMVEFEPYTGGKPSPSPDYPQEIISKEVSEIVIKKSLNLFDKSKIEKLKTIINDGKFEDNGSSHISGYIPVKPSTTYSMTGTRQTRGKFYTSDKKGIGTDYNFNPYNDTTFKTDENTYFIQFCLGASSDGSNVMLNEGDTLLPYMDYSEEYQKVTLSQPITLRGIPVSSGGNVTIDGQQYISDVICEKDGVIGVERRCKTFNVNPDAGIYNNPNHDYKGFYVNNNLFENMNRREGYGSYIPVSSNFNFTDTSERIILGSVNTIMYFIFSSFYNENEEDKGLANFISYLTEHPLQIITYTTTPTFEPLPEEIQAQYKALKSYYPNTVIQTGCWNEVEYVADTKTWIENKLNGVTELALGIGGK